MPVTTHRLTPPINPAPLVLLVHLAAGWVAAAADLPSRIETLQYLEARQREQAKAAAASTVFRDFRFTDRRGPSGITFEHHVVEDAGKSFVVGHYDHGMGLAAADVDGDGRTDLFFPTQLGRCELWRNLGGGRFADITAASGIQLWDQVCVGASFADIDNDGDPDLFVTTIRHGNRLYENLGGGKFRDISREAGVDESRHSAGALFFDFDRDGLLDLLVCHLGRFTTDTTGPGGFYRSVTNAFSGHLFPDRAERKTLFRNLGGRRFRDVTEEVGLADRSWSGDASACDLDGDGFPDVYLTNMQGDDHFYRNIGGRRFEETTSRFFPKTPWGSMGLKFFDFNNDGRPDLYVTDMHSDMTTSQIREAQSFGLGLEKRKSETYCSATYTEEFLQGSTNNLFGNAFFENTGDGRFVERSDELGLETWWPWGPSAGDLNADGFEDLFVTAGMGYKFQYAINSVLLNEAGRRFIDAEFLVGVEPRLGGRTEKTHFVLRCSGPDKDHPLCQDKLGSTPVTGSLSSRSAVVFDLDGDGDLDVVTAEMNDAPQVLVSDLAQRRAIHWVAIRLVGRTSNRDGLGAVVTVHAGGRGITRFQDGKTGYLAQSSVPLHFGLGDATAIERVEIVWPSGLRQTVNSGLKMNGTLAIEETAK